MESGCPRGQGKVESAMGKERTASVLEPTPGGGPSAWGSPTTLTELAPAPSNPKVQPARRTLRALIFKKGWKTSPEFLLKASILFEMALYVALPIFSGGAIYILWRSNQLRVFSWIDSLGLSSLVSSIRVTALPIKNQVPAFLLYSLPDGLWTFAVTSCMIIIWKGQRGLLRAFWVSIGAFLALASELAQSLCLIPGAFTLLDVMFYLIGISLAFLLLTDKRRKQTC